MRIVLCDDQPQELAGLEQAVQEWIVSLNDTGVTLQAYGNSLHLLSDLEDYGPADLYILDIDMPGASGIEIARRLVENYPSVMLYFYTSHEEYATQGYKLEAKRFILKSDSSDDLIESLDYAYGQYNKKVSDCISFISSHNTINIPIEDIMYVERVRRETRIHTNHYGTIYDRRGVRELYSLLNQKIFIFIDKGIFINIKYVFSSANDKIILFNKTEFYISRRRAAEVKKAIMHYWGDSTS